MHFVTGGFSGATQVAVDLCTAHAGTASLLVLRRKKNTSPARLTALQAQGVNVAVVPGWLNMLTVFRLWQLCRQWKPDILVAHGFSEHLWGRYAGLLAGVPTLVHVEHNVRERYGHWRLWQSRWLAQRTARIVAVSQAVCADLVRTGHPPGLCMVIHNGIHTERWHHGLPWADRESALVMPARFARQKDHATLIRALALLAERGYRPKLYLAGAGKERWRRAAERLADSLGVQSQIVFLGHYPELPALLARVKWCVLSTHYEGLGLGLMEGMASGCCAIGSDVEGVQEVITHGQTGWLVTPGDAHAWAQTLEAAITNDGRSAQLAQLGMHHAHTQCDRQRMCRDYQQLFKAISTRTQ